MMAKPKKKNSVPRQAPGRRARAPNYKRQAKQLLAMAYLIHEGNMSRAAKATGIPQRTANSWRERHHEEWDELMQEARAQRAGFMNQQEQDSTWKDLAKMIDRVATLGAEISIKMLLDIEGKFKSGGRPTDKEKDIGARLFGIGSDKAMAIRGIGRMAADAGVFEDFKERMAARLAARLVEDPKVAKRVGKIIADDGNGEIVNVRQLTTYTPKPPAND